MSIFQSSVVTKHLKTQNKEKIAIQWELFKTHFHNPTIQDNIRNSKEEQYQGGFLIDLFVNVLGYTKNPTPNFNITTEYKNVKDSKKADGAIVVNEVVKAVIELKGTNTTDLSKIEVQAFGYKNNQPECTYVITSNFEKLRFYIDNAIEHIEFNLFILTEKEFELLYLCLAYENIEKNIPKKLKEESLSQEDAITKKLYNDYSQFKRELHQSLVILNPQFDAITLFQKSQKLLDRFLFLFFAEDRQLLPPNSVRMILEQWIKLKDLDAYTPLFDRFKKYFGYLNTGYKGKQYDVYAYNGGLFKADAVLDTITIDDDLLYKHTLKLSEYDFDSEVDVNILGHIFENSLNELDEIKAQLEGQEIDKSKTKRKKDGVFYTPKYITKYIVKNTVGKLCEEKKAELEIVEDDYNIDKKRQKKTIKGLIDKLTEYRNWLLQLTICDPAVGSGAFLNQALDFLILEHKYIDELQAKLFGDAMVLSDVENSILENNLFGVDLNEESVEIAKLSLWLRTAQPNRKLNDLNNNIKCGNSLIDDVEVAGEKAFNWQQEFPQIFAKGGFDVVIGNPPYVKRQNLTNISEIDFLEKKYSSATYNFDLYLLFLEKGASIINTLGLISYINPSKFTSTKTGDGIRGFFEKNCHIVKYIDFKEYQIFDDATTYCCIIIYTKGEIGFTEYYELNDVSPKEIESFDKSIIQIKSSSSGIGWQFKNTVEIKGHLTVNEIANTFTGIETGADNIYIIKKDNPYLKDFIKFEGEIIYPILKGADLGRYNFEALNQYGIIPYKSQKDLFSINEIKDNYKTVYDYLESNKIELEKRDKGKMNGDKWYGYVYPKNLFKYSNTRIIWSDISIRPQFTIDYNSNWHVRTVCSLELKEEFKFIENKFLLTIFNSSLFQYYVLNNSNAIRGGYLRYRPQYIKEFKIPDISNINQTSLIVKADSMLSLNKELQEVSQKFQRALEREFSLDVLPKKLQDWYSLSFTEFIKELEKKKVKLSLSQKGEWEDYFLQESKKALGLKSQIDTTDKEIDQMVYELYGLTEEEIEIVENS